MAIRVLAAVALLMAVACSSSADKTRTAGSTDPDRGGAGPTGKEPDRVVSLTEDDCMALLDHYLTVAAAEKPEEARPTREQLAEIRSGMVDAAKQDCVGQPRSGSYECAMQATSSQAIGKCLSDAGGPK